MKYAIIDLLDKTQRGWVYIYIDGVRRSVCYNTTITLLRQEDNFELVKILDGPFIGKIAKIPYKVKSRDHRISYLEEDKKSRGDLIVKYDLKKKELSFLDFKIKTVHNDMLARGRYRLLIPRYPHNKSRKYVNELDDGTRFAETWFQIELSNDIFGSLFVHFGSVTEGCVTVVDSGKLWTKIYLNLMSNRVDDRSIAFLEVY